MALLNIRRFSEAVLGLFVLAIVAMLLVPLETWTLDILLSLNIAISLLVLLIGLFIPNALSLLSFPSLLLLTTLFRLALNVASSRLILTQADAGRVIEAFGRFLVRGDVIVGIIIFAIITVVNLIVISRGASRVSEVAARFALDSLPGKQISIDADLRSGVINPEQARERREDLRREYQLYAAMDGSMKFVQGDAIAGIFIIFTNIFGGIYRGLSQGLSFSDALSTYTILTVGDGLVTQLPALLIAVCAGLVVTRVSADEVGTLSSDLVAQLSGQPRSWIVTGCIVLALSLLPGMPKVPFILVASAFLITGIIIYRGSKIDLLLGKKNADRSRSLPENDRLLPNNAQSLELVIDSRSFSKSYRENVIKAASAWHEISNEFKEEYGITLPELRVEISAELSKGSFQVRWGGTTIDQGTLYADALFVDTHPDFSHIIGAEIIAEDIHPLYEQRVSWLRETPLLSSLLSQAGISYYSAIEYPLLRTAAFFRRQPEEVFSVTDTHALMKVLEKNYPGFMGDAFQKDGIDLSKLTELIQELIKEGVNVSDFRRVIEVVALYHASHKALVSDGEEIDIHHLASFVRVQWRRRLMAQSLDSLRHLKVFTLAQSVEEVFDQAPLESTAAVLPLEPESLEMLLVGFQSSVAPVIRNGAAPVSILCRAEIRPKVNILLRNMGFGVKVFSYDELDPSVEIEQVGVWSV
jgi:type III secretion protein V